MYEDIVEFMEAYKDISSDKIKDNIRRIRREKRLKPSYFVDRGIPANNYKSFENKAIKYKPSLESLIKFCNILNIELKNLLTD